MLNTKNLIATLGALIVIAIGVFFFAFFQNDYGEITVTDIQRVNVMNLDGVENLSGEFRFMDTGLITVMGKIQRIAEYKNQVLVRYTTPGYSAYNPEIPEGTIFFLSKDKFIEMVKGK